MTLPQDYRSPHDQARWLEIENVGSVEIPAFGACELVDSVRVESSGYTPGDGRIVYKARRSTVDSPCSSIINFACPIPPGQSRRIGTMDSPMLALVADSEYPVNTRVGIRKDSFLLEKGYCGYLVISTDFDAPTGTLRVKLSEDCGSESMMVRAVSCILPGKGGSVQPQQWNVTTRCWEDSDDQPFDIIDPMGWLLAVTNDCFKVDRQQRCGSSYGSNYMPAFPFGMTQLVRVMEKIDCGQCGEVVVVRKIEDSSGHCETTETECRFQACNMSYRPISCDAREFALAQIIPGQCCLPEHSPGYERCLATLMPYPRPIFAKGTLAGPLCEGAASLSDSTILDACAASDFQPPTAALNTVGLHACSGEKVLALWRLAEGEEEQPCAWDIIAVADAVLPEWVVNLRCSEGDDCAAPIEKSKKPFEYYGHFCKCDETAEDIWTGTAITSERVELVSDVEVSTGSSAGDLVSSLECGDCSIIVSKKSLTAATGTVRKKSYCLICPKAQDGTDGDPFDMLSATGATSQSTITGTPIDVVTGLGVQTEVIGEEGGDDVDCETGLPADLNLVIVGTTSRVCAFCNPGGGGAIGAGTSVKLTAMKLSEITPVTEAVFSCDPCPSLSVKTTGMYGLCVQAEGSADVSDCVCVDCETTGSSSPSATGA